MHEAGELQTDCIAIALCIRIWDMNLYTTTFV